MTISIGAHRNKGLHSSPAERKHTQGPTEIDLHITDL